MIRILSLLAFFTICFATTSFSQSVSHESYEIRSAGYDSDSIDQSVFMDVESKTCYLDLERVPMHLKQAALINESGDEVMVKSLADVPVNSIVELDYSELPSGSYLLELRSYTGKTHKALQL